MNTIVIMSGHLEIEKLTTLGKEIGLKGKDLIDFIDKHRLIIKEERDEERRIRAEERERRLEEVDYEERLLEKQIALEEQKLRTAQAMKDTKHSGTVPDHSFTKAPKLPAFDESRDNIDAYILRFERYAAQQNWAHDQWAVYLSTLLSGKGLEVYYSLSEEQARDYDTLKKCILNRYDMNEEGFRKKLKNSKPETSESGPQYAVRIINYFNRWVELATHSNNPDKAHIIDLIIRDQFMHSIPNDMATFIRERKPKNVDAMTQLADQYIEAHSGWWFSSGQGSKGKGNSRPNFRGNDDGSKPGNTTNPSQNRPKTYREGNSSNNPSQVRGACYICNKSGHHARNCRTRPRLNALLDTNEGENKLTSFLDTANEEKGDRPTCTHTCTLDTQSSVNSCNDKAAFMMVRTDQPEVIPNHGVYKLDCGHELTVITAACPAKCPLRSRDKEMVVVDGYVGGHKVKSLRDTGCDGVVVKENLVRPEQKTGKYVTCVLLDGTVRRFQTAVIQIDTPFFVGEILAKMCTTPVYDLILGQSATMRDVNNPDTNWTSNAVSSQPKMSEGVRKTSVKCTTEEKLQDNPTVILPRIEIKTEIGSAVETRSQAKTRNKPFKPLIVPTSEEALTPELLKQKQSEDPTLHKIREAAESSTVKQCRGGGTSVFVKDKGIIYRDFKAPNIEYGNEFRQAVVPHEYRRQVMKIAHEAILGGHQGAKKTHDRIGTNFYWPGMGADIKRYCQSCDICQRTIPKGRVTKVPLGQMPIIDTPFERVAVDLVGPIHPTTERGHRYILVLIDYATRYPEAVPLKTIEAEVIAEELLTMFTRLGVPKQILTDQGSQFTSNVWKELNRLLSIKPLVTTPYHAMCNGAVERHNGILKGGLKKMCEERPKDWDRYINPLLFAYRDTPQSTTGFAPFELLYGRSVRGPMTILSELWTGESEEGETKNTYQYVIDLQNRLETTCQLARQQIQKSKEKYSAQYNKKAKAREYDEGDEVLLLLPTDRNKLLMHWKGPFKIVKKNNRMNYQIDLGSRKQTFHINMLKKYYRRGEVGAVLEEVKGGTAFEIAAVAIIQEEIDNEPDDILSSDTLLYLPPLTPTETVKDVKISPELEEDQTTEVKRILGHFKDVLTDIPGKTNLGKHTIELTDEEPVRCKPYPIPHAVRGEVHKELDKMLEMGIIRRSESPYACPLTAVAKSDGSTRVCCDTRLLNAKTVFNPEPISDQEEIFAQIAQDNYFSKIDLSKGYWQVPMAEDSKKYTGFVVPGGSGGHFEFNFMPFGLVNSAQTFSKIMRKLLHGLRNVHNYIDDILIHTTTWEEHVKLLKEVMRRLQKTGLTARPTKCHIGYSEVEFLGHVVGNGILKPRPQKVDSIREAKRPETKTQLRSFLGLVGYYRKFIPNFASVACPLTDRTRKGESNKIRWEASQDQAFQTLKKRVTSAPILHLPDLSKTFILRSDASEYGLGAVLLQERLGEKFPIAFASKKMSDCQRRYAVIEKECLAIVWAVAKFQAFLFGREFVIETDHQPLACLRKSKVSNGRIMRWALSLQPYRYRIEVIKGSENIGADYMSRV